VWLVRVGQTGREIAPDHCTARRNPAAIRWALTLRAERVVELAPIARGAAQESRPWAVAI